MSDAKAAWRLTVGDLMAPEVVTLDLHEDLNLAANMMATGRIRHLPVVDDEGRLMGLVTHRDVLRLSASDLEPTTVEHRRQALREITVSEVMTANVDTVRPDTPLAAAAQHMIDQKYGCLPVTLDDGTLVGIVTEADFVALAVRLMELASGKQPALPSEADERLRLE